MLHSIRASLVEDREDARLTAPPCIDALFAGLERWLFDSLLNGVIVVEQGQLHGLLRVIRHMHLDPFGAHGA